MLFYNQVLGVSPALAGLAYLIVSIVDAVTDPLVGAWSDRFHSRWGRRHPFMFFSAFPIAIGFYFLYQPISGLSEAGLFVWLIVFFALVRLGQTLYLIPHDALGAELTNDYDDRTSIFGFNNVAEMILSMVTVASCSVPKANSSLVLIGTLRRRSFSSSPVSVSVSVTGL